MLSATKDILTIFFLRNEVVTKEYTSMGISPLHARIFYLFITLCNNFHEVHLDNLYMSTIFAYFSYTHNNCVKLQGVYKTGDLVILRELLQTDFTIRN